MRKNQRQRRTDSVQDRTLSDLLESYRHLISDPSVPRDAKASAEQRMTDVWAKIARLNDDDGFIKFLGEYISREHTRRHEPESIDESRRTKPLCSCNLSRHACEAKSGNVPSEIQTVSLEYLTTADPRPRARQYVQSHSGDIIIQEAMNEFTNLRADIYSELTSILSMLRTAEQPSDDVVDSKTALANGSSGGD